MRYIFAALAAFFLTTSLAAAQTAELGVGLGAVAGISNANSDASATGGTAQAGGSILNGATLGGVAQTASASSSNLSGNIGTISGNDATNLSESSSTADQSSAVLGGSVALGNAATINGGIGGSSSNADGGALGGAGVLSAFGFIQGTP